MAKQKRVWVLVGDKGGDNAQIDIVLDRLGWRDNPAYDVQTRRLVFKPRYQLGKPPFFASLYHVDKNTSDQLAAPWPDLVLTVGRRPAMAALWIKKHSGNKGRIVLFGRPKRWMRAFDLIIAPVQYQLPPAENLLTIGLPLMRVDEAAVQAAVGKWQPQLSELQRPLVAVLVGGSTKPYELNEQSTLALIRGAAEYVKDTGTLYFSTSRRTPGSACDILARNLPASGRLYTWQQNSLDNPYLALVGSADLVIVTGDSVSMLTEAVRLKKPLLIHALPKGSRSWLDSANLLLRSSGNLPSSRLEKLAVRLGLISYARDLESIHHWLYQRALAAPLGEAPPNPKDFADNDLERVVERLNELL